MNRLTLDDLPPRYRAQAEAQIAARSRGKCALPQSVPAAVATAEKIGMDFDSRGEYEYYMGTILPKVQTGKIVKVELHRTFLLLPEKEYDAVKLPAVHYTPDFVLTYADGTVEAVEVKSKFVRRQQRDYIHRRGCSLTLWPSRGAGISSSISPQTRRQRSKRGRVLQNRKDEEHGKIYAAC